MKRQTEILLQAFAGDNNVIQECIDQFLTITTTPPTLRMTPHQDMFIPQITPFTSKASQRKTPFTIIINMDNAEELKFCPIESQKETKQALIDILRQCQSLSEIRQAVREFSQSQHNRVYGEFSLYTANVHPKEYRQIPDFAYHPFLSVTTCVVQDEQAPYQQIDTIWI